MESVDSLKSRIRQQRQCLWLFNIQCARFIFRCDCQHYAFSLSLSEDFCRRDITDFEAFLRFLFFSTCANLHGVPSKIMFQHAVHFFSKFPHCIMYQQFFIFEEHGIPLPFYTAVDCRLSFRSWSCSHWCYSLATFSPAYIFQRPETCLSLASSFSGPLIS